MHQYRHSEDTHPVPSILYRKKHDGKLLKYDVLQEIGKGGFGIVYSAIESPSKKKVALKCTPKCRLKKQKIKQKLINEMTIHKSLDHPNVVKFLGTFHDEYYIYFILELCEGGNIIEYIKKFNQNGKGVKNFYRMPSNRDPSTFNCQFNLQYLPEFEVIKITKQILKALDYLHSVANVIHRDIKLQNFLLTKNGIVKLSDFGLSVNYDDITDKASIVSICGTPNYISPEVIDQNSHTFAVDIWAVGVIVFLMLTGQRPFKSINNKKTFERIRQVHYDWPIWPSVSEQAKSFVDSILKKNPLDRPSAHKLLKHPFLCMKDDKTNKKSSSSDSSIKFNVPSNNNNLSHNSASAYASTSNSNNASIRSSSNQSTSPSINSQSNSNHSPYSPQKAQNFTLSTSPICFQNNLQNSSSNKKLQTLPSNTQNRSKSVSHKLNSSLYNSPPSPSNLINNPSSGILTTQNKQNRSLSPLHLTNYSSNVKSELFLSPPRTNYESNITNTKSSYYSPPRVGRFNNRMISHIIIPNEHFLDLNEEIKPFEQEKKHMNDLNEDFKVEKSVSVIIKATIETIEDAAKQAEKVQNPPKNNPQKTKPQKSGSKTTAKKQITSSGDNLKEKPDETVKEIPIVQLTQNKDENNLDYRIGFGIIPSSRSEAFPKSSVLLWWDYSSRYGLGYILYNGCVGVCFNDLSRIIMEPTERYAQFYSRPHSKMEIVKLEDFENESDQQELNNDIECNDNNKNEINNQKQIDDDSNLTLPNKKKILILKHFAKNLKKIALKHIDSNLINFHEESSSLLENVTSKQLEYVKYWGTNIKDGILFRMNGKSLQVSFTDKTSLYICSNTKTVIYDDSKAISKVPLRELVGNKKADSPIQSKFLIVKELGKNLE